MRSNCAMRKLFHRHGSAAGLVLTAVVFVTYQVALQFEGCAVKAIDQVALVDF